MTTTLKGLGEMTTEELKALKDEVYEVSREQCRRMGTLAFRTAEHRALRQSCDETIRFLRRVDDELYRRGA